MITCGRRAVLYLEEKNSISNSLRHITHLIGPQPNSTSDFPATISLFDSMQFPNTKLQSYTYAPKPRSALVPPLPLLLLFSDQKMNAKEVKAPLVQLQSIFHLGVIEQNRCHSSLVVLKQSRVEANLVCLTILTYAEENLLVASRLKLRESLSRSGFTCVVCKKVRLFSVQRLNGVSMA